MDSNFGDSQRVVRYYLAGMSVCPPYFHQFSTMGDAAAVCGETPESHIQIDGMLEPIDKLIEARVVEILRRRPVDRKTIAGPELGTRSIPIGVRPEHGNNGPPLTYVFSDLRKLEAQDARQHT